MASRYVCIIEFKTVFFSIKNEITIMKPVKIFSSYFLSRAKVRADHQYQTDTAVNIYPDYPGSGDYSGSGYYPPTYR